MTYALQVADAVLRSTPDLIVRFDLELRRVYANPRFEELSGLGPHQYLGRRLSDLSPLGALAAPLEQCLRAALTTGRLQEMDIRWQSADGRPLVHAARVVVERDAGGLPQGLLLMATDITARKQAESALAVRERELRLLALTDPLTRLHNRQALYEDAPEMIRRALAHGRGLGVIVVDLDRFKDINDSLGHAAGDELLCVLARRFAACLRSEDLLVRLGGDEFACLVGDVGQPAALATVADKLGEALREPMHIGGRQLVPSASIGIALCPADGRSLEALLAHADIAMYHAKRGGGRRHAFYRPEFSTRAHERLVLEQALREAQDGAGLELHYQPVVALPEGRIVGAEALLRWRHPQLGLLAPERFIPLAEETGLIVPIGRWVLDQVALTARRWNEAAARPLRLTLNVSFRQFIDDDLPARVQAALTRHGCRGEWLGIELTESLLLEDTERVQQALAVLRVLGVQIAIDDFGTGYSALGYLASFELDRLKFDRCFISRIERDARQAELVKACVGMARALQLEVVAEGVESPGQAQRLHALGCGLAQGYLFHRPVPADRFEDLLDEDYSAVSVPRNT